MRQCILAAALWACVSASLGGTRSADVIETEDKDEWFALVRDVSMIDFTGTSFLAPIIGQYEQWGIGFGTTVASGSFGSDSREDGWGATGSNGQAIQVSFNTPQYWIATDYVSQVKIELYADGALVYASSNFGQGGAFQFAGLVSTKPFDAVVIDRWKPTGSVIVDNLYVGPARAAITAKSPTPTPSLEPSTARLVCGLQQGHLLDTASQGAQVGFSSAVADGVAVLGSLYDDDRGFLAGAAQVFDVVSGQHLFKLTAFDGAAEDLFGWAVAVGNGVIAVGARKDDDFGTSTGSVYLFDASSGDLIEKVLASNASQNDRFGYAVAADGATMVVGAPGVAITDAGQGAAYVFDLESKLETKVLLTSDMTGQIYFGSAVAIEGDTIAVGTDPSFVLFDPGSVYVFERNDGGPDNWGQVAELTAPDASPGDRVGFAVAVGGDVVVAGAPSYDYNDVLSPGAAYVFRRDASKAQWSFVKKLMASDYAAYDWFGYSVALSGDVLLVGCPYDDGAVENSGSVYIFQRHHGGNDNWGEVGKFAASPEGWLDNFGISLAGDGQTLLAGAVFRDGTAGRNSGSGYLFELDCTPCSADIDGNGVVGVGDLVAVVTGWGPCAGCPGDINGDGTINVPDLVAVIIAWGPCP